MKYNHLFLKSICFLSAALFITHGTLSSYADESIIESRIDKIRKSASHNTPYIFGTDIELNIVPNKRAAILQCNENPDSVEEILIGSDGQYLFIYCILSSGSICGAGSSLYESAGSFRQVGGSAAIGCWKIINGNIQLRFQLTNNDKAIVQSYKMLEKSRKFSKKIRNWGILLDDLELMFPRLTKEQRIEAFTRMWCLVKYNFANFDLVPELDWDDILHEYIPKIVQDQSNTDYIHLLQECIGKLQDGHSQIGFLVGQDQLACPPVQICSIDGKAIISEIAQTKDIIISGIKVGDEITHIDGQPVYEILEKQIYPYISASTSQWRDLKAYPKILQGPTESKVFLAIKKIDGSTCNVQLTRKANGPDLLLKGNRRDDIEIQYLDDEIVYVALNSFGNRKIVQSFRENFDNIKKAKGLIIDVRNNGGGSGRYGRAITANLIQKPIPTTRWKTPQYRPAFQAWGRNEPWYDGGYKMIIPAESIYAGPIVVLVGPKTFSAAEDFVVPLHAAGRAVVVGQKTGGSTGQPLRFSLLGGIISGRVCTKRDQYPDGREFVGVGIIPDIEIHPSIRDIADDRDPVFIAGLNTLKKLLEIAE